MSVSSYDRLFPWACMRAYGRALLVRSSAAQVPMRVLTGPIVELRVPHVSTHSTHGSTQSALCELHLLGGRSVAELSAYMKARRIPNDVWQQARAHAHGPARARTKLTFTRKHTRPHAFCARARRSGCATSFVALLRCCCVGYNAHIYTGAEAAAV